MEGGEGEGRHGAGTQIQNREDNDGTRTRGNGDSLLKRRQDRCVSREEEIRKEASKCEGGRCGERLRQGDGSKAQGHPLRQIEREKQGDGRPKTKSNTVNLMSVPANGSSSSGSGQQRSGLASAPDVPWSYWSQSQGAREATVPGRTPSAQPN